MAANDYYNPQPSQDAGDHRFYDQSPPKRPGLSQTPSSSSSPYDDNRFKHSYQNSQQTLSSEPGYYAGAGGRLHDSMSYADSIPLKTHAQPNASEEWIHPNTQDSLSPESQRPPPLRDTSQRHRGKKSRLGPTKHAWFVYFITTVQLSVFIAELVRNAQLTGSPVEIHPQINPMLGPSPYVLINMGARFVPCMKNTRCVQDQETPPNWPCPKTTTNNASSPDMQCTLQELCGFPSAKVPNPDPSHRGTSLTQTPAPNQWFRFIIPMFLHAGFIHIGFNLLLQLSMGREMELIIGPIRFALVYFSSGIFGFVLGGNFAPAGIASTGASGCLFGVLALVLLDLLYTWREQRNPKMDLFWICLDIIVSFVLGLLPGLDNFSHIGGFLMGLVLGICILHSPNALRERTGQDDPPYTPMGGRKTTPFNASTLQGFAKAPVGFFKGRKPFWWAWWLIRAGALVGVLIGFIVLVTNFYKTTNSCSWCKYLSCLNIKNWCNIGNLTCDSKA